MCSEAGLVIGAALGLLVRVFSAFCLGLRPVKIAGSRGRIRARIPVRLPRDKSKNRTDDDIDP
jgi:hypothetical protein